MNETIKDSTQPADNSGSSTRWEPGFLDGHAVLPLIDGIEVFDALETAMQEARTSIDLAYLMLDPVARNGNGSQRWVDLLIDAARRGVQVRLLINDFDPILAPDLHRRTWEAYRQIMEARAGRPSPERERLQPVVCLHPSRVGVLALIPLLPVVRKGLREELDGLIDLSRREGHTAAMRAYQDSPGLWRHIAFDGEVGSVLTLEPFEVHPAVHHEKLCLIDGRVAFVGGVDIELKRMDTHDHDSPEAWHDVALRVAGPICAAIAAHFEERWRRDTRCCAEYLDGLPEVAGANRPVRVPDYAQREPVPVPTGPNSGSGRMALLRTASANRPGVDAVTPEPVVSEIAKGVEWLIGRAERSLFIETQFLREQRIADWIRARAEERPALRVSVVLPLLPERLTTNQDNPATRHGQYLQAEILRELSECLGLRMSLYTLIRDGEPPRPAPREVTYLGSDLIYCHAKVLIADDRIAMVGSPNLNGRSFWCDTEAALLWEDPEGVRAFRARLTRLLAGVDAPTAEIAAALERSAIAASRQPPGKRGSFLVPFPVTRTIDTAERSALVPDALV